MGTRIWLFIAILLMLAGCGGGGSLGSFSSKSATSSGGNSPSPAYASRESAAPGYAPSSTATSAGAGSDFRALETRNEAPPTTPEARERPGLGTQWGESRESRVHDVTFVRADTDRPFAVAALHYNDLAGVQSLAAFHDSRTGHFREVPSGGGAISISIRDANGSPLEALKTGERTYVIGQEGERYSIVLTNHTNHRFEAVATVDGLDVVNGQVGTLANRGYVLMPFATLEIDGFRQSHDAVAAFRFARVSDSYAAQTSGDRNVGVIGVAFFGERGDAFEPWNQDDLEQRDTASPFPAADPRFAHPPHS